MTRRWAPLIQQIQEAIVAALERERALVATAGALPAALRATDGRLAVAAGVFKDATDLLPHAVTVYPFDGGDFSTDATQSLHAVLEFPVSIVALGNTDAETLLHLRELQGLLVDALDADSQLGGLVVPADPFLRVVASFVDGTQASQQWVVRVQLRAESG